MCQAQHKKKKLHFLKKKTNVRCFTQVTITRRSKKTKREQTSDKTSICDATKYYESWKECLRILNLRHKVRMDLQTWNGPSWSRIATDPRGQIVNCSTLRPLNMLWTFVRGKGNPLAFSNVVLLTCGVVPGSQHSKNGINLLGCWRKTLREKKPGNALKTCTKFEKHTCTKKLVHSAASMHVMS